MTNASKARIVLDVMGGDNAPQATIAGAVAARRNHGVETILVGDYKVVASELRAHGEIPTQYQIEHAGEVVQMDEQPASAVQQKLDSSIRVAAAVEMVHAYSLVHDDLPCMDDDDLRRGRATTHIRFDEPTAVLTGDALLTQAFGIITNPKTHKNAEIRAELICALSHAVGAKGMCGGQMMDLLAKSRLLGESDITRLQTMKTGALLAFCCQAGAILGCAGEKDRQLQPCLVVFEHDAPTNPE